MKFALVLLIASAITGLGEAHQYPDFGSLHKDIHVLEKTLEDDFADFMALVPLMSWIDIIENYNKEDKEVQGILEYLLSSDFHASLSTLENLKEFKEFVIYMEHMGYHTITKIQFIHKMIGMDDYVPPEMKSIIKSQFGVQEVGEGLKGMLKDLQDELPLEEIDNLYKEKMANPESAFAVFVNKFESAETKNIVISLRNTNIYKELDAEAKGKGLEFEEIIKLYFRIYGIKLSLS